MRVRACLLALELVRWQAGLPAGALACALAGRFQGRVSQDMRVRACLLALWLTRWQAGLPAGAFGPRAGRQVPPSVPAREPDFHPVSFFGGDLVQTNEACSRQRFCLLDERVGK